MAEKEEKIEVEGEVVESFRSGMYRIALENGHETLGYTAGKMRRYRIRMNPGDRVRIEDGDSIVFFNFRPDRMREITLALASSTFDVTDAST